MTRLSGSKPLIGITIVTAIMIVVAAASVLTIQAPRTTTAHGSQATIGIQGLQTQCSSTFPDGLQLQTTNDTNRKIAFEIQPGSVDALCITYTINGNVSLGDFKATLASVNATRLHNSRNGTTGYEYSYSPVPSVNITSDAESLDLTYHNNSTTVTVVYTITALSGADGFYALEYPNHCPSLIPFAVTNDPQGVTSADFPGFFQPGSCERYVPLGVSVTGFTGMSTIWLGPTSSSTSLASSSIQA
jgi:hypothetical protein